MKNATLSELFVFLLKRSDEAFARAEAMRLLLQQHGVCSEAEVETLYAQLVAQKKQQTAQLIARVKKAEHDETLSRLLRDFEGTIQ